MRRIVFEASVSLDGFIAGPNDEIDWMEAGTEGVFDCETFFKGFDTIFFGRRTYEMMALPQFSLSVLDEEDRRFFFLLYAMRKYVFSRRQKHVKGNGMVLSGDLQEEVGRIRAERGKNILFCGGAELLATFADLNLIDEYVLAVHPVLINSGKALFSENRSLVDLELIDKRHLKSGVVVLHYRSKKRINGSRLWPSKYLKQMSTTANRQGR